MESRMPLLPISNATGRAAHSRSCDKEGRMMSILIAGSRLILPCVGLLWWIPPSVHAESARWNVDPEHSMIEFRVVHMVVSKTTGHFTDYQGFIDMDAEAGTVKAIEATIK